MRILLTNDDGINAPGLQVLEAIARNLTNEENIFIIAPSGERSELGIVLVTMRPHRLREFQKTAIRFQDIPPIA